MCFMVNRPINKYLTLDDKSDYARIINDLRMNASDSEFSIKFYNPPHKRPFHVLGISTHILTSIL